MESPATDARSLTFARELDTRLYPRKALIEATRAFKAHCAVRTRPVDTHRLRVELTPHGASHSENREICLAFWNYALDLACQNRIARE